MKHFLNKVFKIENEVYVWLSFNSQNQIDMSMSLIIKKNVMLVKVVLVCHHVRLADCMP